jgi:DNA-binding NarL/FixJ family response regulator
MARRIIRRRRPPGTRVVRRPARAAAPVEAQPQAVRPPEPTGTPVLMATTNLVRNLILPKLATMPDVQLAGLADNPGNAIKMLVQDHPEVVMLDMDFGGPFIGLDTARMMQKTRVRAAIVMLVPELIPEELRTESRRFGSSWSYIKTTTAGRVDVLQAALKSAMRGVQWVEPDISRALNTIWKIAEQARDTESARAASEPVAIKSPSSYKPKRAAQKLPSETPTDEAGEAAEAGEAEEYDVETAPGIKTLTTNESAVDGYDTTSSAIGHGGIGQNVGGVRKRRTG